MSILNEFAVITSRRRWMKRLFKSLQPTIAYKRILNFVNFHYDPRDMKGPSFHFSYDLEKGFLNYEEVARNLLLDHLPDNGVMYDVGANIGMFTIYSAYKKPNARIVAFEPEKLVHKCLKKSVESIKDNNITIFNKAVGEIEENKNLYHSTVNDGGHSFVTERDDEEKKFGDFEEVQVVNIDNLVTKNEIPAPNVVKIDVEGFELEVLKGMKKTIEKSKPVILVEASDLDFAERSGIWSFLNDLERCEVLITRPGLEEKYSLDEISKVAKSQLNKGIEVSNYLVWIK